MKNGANNKKLIKYLKHTQKKTFMLIFFVNNKDNFEKKKCFNRLKYGVYAQVYILRM